MEIRIQLGVQGFAARPTRGARRVAVPAPRRVVDVVPAWGLVVFGITAVALAVGLGLAMTGMLVGGSSPGGFALLAVSVVLIGLGWNLVTPPVCAEAPVRA